MITHYFLKFVNRLYKKYILFVNNQSAASASVNTNFVTPS